MVYRPIGLILEKHRAESVGDDGISMVLLYGGQHCEFALIGLVKGRYCVTQAS